MGQQHLLRLKPRGVIHDMGLGCQDFLIDGLVLGNLGLHLCSQPAIRGNSLGSIEYATYKLVPFLPCSPINTDVLKLLLAIACERRI